MATSSAENDSIPSNSGKSGKKVGRPRKQTNSSEKLQFYTPEELQQIYGKEGQDSTWVENKFVPLKEFILLQYSQKTLLDELDNLKESVFTNLSEAVYKEVEEIREENETLKKEVARLRESHSSSSWHRARNTEYSVYVDNDSGWII